MGALTAFQRNGKPVTLTVNDYACRTGITVPQARGALRRLAAAGLVARSVVRGRTIFRRVDAGEQFERWRR